MKSRIFFVFSILSFFGPFSVLGAEFSGSQLNGNVKTACVGHAAKAMKAAKAEQAANNTASSVTPGKTSGDAGLADSS